jgi:GAF domain-containing protein
MIPESLADPEYKDLDEQRAVGYRTLLAVPIQKEGTIIGVIATARNERFAGSVLDEPVEPQRPMIDVTPEPPEPIVSSIDLWQPWDRRQSPFD